MYVSARYKIALLSENNIKKIMMCIQKYESKELVQRIILKDECLKNIYNLGFSRQALQLIVKLVLIKDYCKYVFSLKLSVNTVKYILMTFICFNQKIIFRALSHTSK
jgi:hypothetical protein